MGWGYAIPKTEAWRGGTARSCDVSFDFSAALLRFYKKSYINTRENDFFYCMYTQTGNKLLLNRFTTDAFVVHAFIQIRV